MTVMVPANYNDCLQPLDISSNKAVRDFLRQEFQVRYLEQLSVLLDYQYEGEPSPVDLLSVIMKEVGAKWLVRMIEHVERNPSPIVNGFVHAIIS